MFFLDFYIWPKYNSNNNKIPQIKVNWKNYNNWFWKNNYFNQKNKKKNMIENMDFYIKCHSKNNILFLG